MSSTTSPVFIDPNRSQVPMSRLINAEFRKLFDTLASRWLLIVTAILLILAVVGTLLIAAFVDEFTPTASVWVGVLTLPLSILLPIFPILTVTSEWGQRSHLTLFTLEPNRLRILAAKLITVLGFAVAIVLFTIILGAIGNVVGAAISGGSVEWDVTAGDLGWQLFAQLGYFLIAFGFGMVFLNTPLAVSLFYVVIIFVPNLVYSVLIGLFDWAREFIPFIDFGIALSYAQGVGFDGVSGVRDAVASDYLKLFVASILWIVVPMVLGFARVLKSEVK